MNDHPSSTISQHLLDNTIDSGSACCMGGGFFSRHADRMDQPGWVVLWAMAARSSAGLIKKTLYVGAFATLSATSTAWPGSSSLVAGWPGRFGIECRRRSCCSQATAAVGVRRQPILQIRAMSGFRTYF